MTHAHALARHTHAQWLAHRTARRADDYTAECAALDCRITRRDLAASQPDAQQISAARRRRAANASLAAAVGRL